MRSLEGTIMAKQAIWVMLKAKPGKEAEIEAFLAQGAQMAQDETGTVTWYGVKLAPGMSGVFDTFSDEAGARCAPPWRDRPGADDQSAGAVCERAAD